MPVVSVPKGMAHAEGGWARDDVEGLLRFRKKVSAAPELQGHWEVAIVAE